MTRVCIIGCGAIGSLYAAHLARVSEVWTFVRRPEHARDLNVQGLRVSGTHDFHSRVHATANPGELPECEFGIVSTKATQTAEALAPVAERLRSAALLSVQNGLGSEEVIAGLTHGPVMRGTTFMSGTRISDTHVKYELDTPTWMGPFEPTRIPFARVQELADLVVAGGLKAIALEDARPAQWSKLIFNASVNSVAALTDLPHCRLFAEEQGFEDLGHLLRALIDEGKHVAAALGIALHDDPWEMNCVGARTDHMPSMLYDVRHRLHTEADSLGGAIAHEARRAGISAPLHEALYCLIKGRESSWSWKSSAKGEAGD